MMNCRRRRPKTKVKTAKQKENTRNRKPTTTMTMTMLVIRHRLKMRMMKGKLHRGRPQLQRQATLSTQKRQLISQLSTSSCRPAHPPVYHLDLRPVSLQSWFVHLRCAECHPACLLGCCRLGHREVVHQVYRLYRPWEYLPTCGLYRLQSVCHLDHQVTYHTKTYFAYSISI